VRKTEPHTGVGNLIEHSSRRDNDPLSRRAQIASRARIEPKMQFTNLAHHLSYELVEESLKKIPKNSASGINGMTVEQAMKNLDWLLPPILDQIHKEQYQAPAVRRVYIPKADGKQRPIGIPEVIDRSLQAGMAQILNEIYEQDFLPCSFGFRPKLGCHHALATVGELIGKYKLNHALEVDIRDFFGSLNQEWLRKFLALRVGDKRVLKLLESWLKAGVMEQDKWQATEKGAPQGGSISPLLANIYLHYVLDLWFEKKIKKRLNKRAHLVRYCDDFVILFEDQKDLEDTKTLLTARLEQFGLSIAESKTHTTNLTSRENGESHERRRITFLGFDIFKAKRREGSGYKIVYQTEGKRYTRAKASMKVKLQSLMHAELSKQATHINAILLGHFNYYGMAGNSKRLENFRHETVRYWRRCLSRRSQKGKINWTKYNEILKEHRLLRPRIKISYPQLFSYVRM
jgi:RNA-directed DNA polymerase